MPNINKLFKIIIWLIITTALLEIMLRIQQAAGPVYDLEFETIYYDLQAPSDILNHKQVSIPKEHVFINKKIKFKGYYDRYGIRINALRPDLSQDKEAFKILFMGDSFIEGYDDTNTIDQHIWEYLKNTDLRGIPIGLLNAACTTYSPAIFIPQAKYLIPAIKPDFIVMDIDETDLGDDFIRYKDLMVRDETGRIIAVRKTPINEIFLKGFSNIRNQSLYVVRFLQKIYHTRIYMPITARMYRTKDPRHALSFSIDKDRNAGHKYAKEIAFFRNNIFELLETLIYLMGNKDKILLIYHPHLGHIKPDQDGFYWNNFVSGTLKEASDKYQVAFYNATEDLQEKANGHPEKYYLLTDMHFNFEGLKIYGDLVAEKLLPLIRPFINNKQ